MLSTDRRDLALDTNNNLRFEGGDFVWSVGLPGVVQACKIRLSMFRGEWFLNRLVGISYWAEILGKKPERAIAAITSEFYEALLGVEDVVEVTRMDIAYNGSTRALTVKWAVRTRFGDSTVQVFRLDN